MLTVPPERLNVQFSKTIGSALPCPEIISTVSSPILYTILVAPVLLMLTPNDNPTCCASSNAPTLIPSRLAPRPVLPVSPSAAKATTGAIVSTIHSANSVDNNRFFILIFLLFSFWGIYVETSLFRMEFPMLPPILLSAAHFPAGCHMPDRSER